MKLPTQKPSPSTKPIANALKSLRPLSFYLFVLSLFAALPALAQTSGDYRSSASGNWNVVGTWQTYNGTAWVAATAAPTSAANVVTITTGTFVTNTAALTMDQIVVQSGATLASSATLTLANGAGTDLDIFGTFIALGGTSLSIQAGAAVVVESGGFLIHNGTSSSFVTVTGTIEVMSGGTFILERAGGTIPIATWDIGSSCQVDYTTASTSKPTAQSQTFNNFVWNNPLQSGSTDLSGNLNAFTGDFVLLSSGGQELKWTGDANFGGNLIVSNGSLNVSGSTATRTWNLTGDLKITAGGQLNVSASSSGSYTLNLVGTGTQNYTCAGANIATKLNWTVNSSSILNLNNDLPMNAAGRTLTASGIVNLNGHMLSCDQLAGAGTIRNQGGGNGILNFGTGNTLVTLDGSLNLVDGTSGTLGLIKGGNSTVGILDITAPFTYSGGLTVSNGYVLLDNTTGSATGTGGITMLNGILGGTGSETGPVTFNGGTLNPGDSGVATLTLNGALTMNAGNAYMEIDKSTAQTNDIVAGLTTVTYGGTLTATNIGGIPFAAGDGFKFFKATTYLGSFTTINPPTPGAGLAWDTSTLNTDGTLRVKVGTVASPTLSFVPSGSTLTFSWTDPTFKLQVQTNALGTGIYTNWSDYPGGGTSPVPVNIDPTSPSVYFRLSQ